MGNSTAYLIQLYDKENKIALHVQEKEKVTPLCYQVFIRYKKTEINDFGFSFYFITFAYLLACNNFASSIYLSASEA